MIGILFLIVIAIWLVAAVLLSARLPRWVGIKKHTAAVSLLLFPLLLTAPIADELIGRWQFNRLCEREAVVTLSPDANKVTRAREDNHPITEIGGHVIPIDIQRAEYVDLDTGRTFLAFKAFHTKGGFLMRHGLGLDGTTSCWPINLTQVMNDLNADQLIKQGKTK